MIGALAWVALGLIGLYIALEIYVQGTWVCAQIKRLCWMRWAKRNAPNFYRAAKKRPR